MTQWKPLLDIPEFKAFLLFVYTNFTLWIFFFYCEKLGHVSKPYFPLMPGAIWLGCKSFFSVLRFMFLAGKDSLLHEHTESCMHTESHRHVVCVLGKWTVHEGHEWEDCDFVITYPGSKCNM